MQDEFVKQIEHHQSIIHKVINLYVQNTHDKADLFQEILFQSWHSFPTFKSEAKFSTWLYRVALNTAIAFIRKQKKRSTLFDKENLQYFPDFADATDNERVELLYQLIAKLSPVDKALIMLYIDNYEHQEIAAITGLTVSNVGVKISRIKQTLRKEGKLHVNRL